MVGGLPSPYPSPLQSPGLRTTPGFQEIAGEEGAARGLGTAGMPQLESPAFLPAGAAHLATAGSRCVLTMQVCGERRRGEEQAPGPGTTRPGCWGQGEAVPKHLASGSQVLGHQRWGQAWLGLVGRWAGPPERTTNIWQ